MVVASPALAKRRCSGRSSDTGTSSFSSVVATIHSTVSALDCIIPLVNVERVILTVTLGMASFHSRLQAGLQNEAKHRRDGTSNVRNDSNASNTSRGHNRQEMATTMADE
jgi:hypothetical protein